VSNVPTKRGNVYWFDSVRAGRRLRFSFGTTDQKAARTLTRTVENALAEGPGSEAWGVLRSALPPKSFAKLSSGVSLTADTSLPEFEDRFLSSLGRKVKLGELAPGTLHSYETVVRPFFSRMIELGVRKMDEITAHAVESYLIERKEGTRTGRPLKNSSLEIQRKVLRVVFNQAVEEGSMKKPPLKKTPKRLGEDPKPVPFSAEDLAKMESVLDDETRLPYTIFRATGLRISDVASLTWREWDSPGSSIQKLTAKRKNWVTIPLTACVQDLLCEEDSRHSPPKSLDDLILGLPPSKLYSLIKVLGKKAGVENCHPHRFRTTRACELLAAGCTLYDVAAMLGDTAATVEKYYASTSDKQQERIRDIMEKSG
jgi:integrase/recombinase XerD